jgi:hypothetical protein
VRVVSDSVGDMSDSPVAFDMTIAFPVTGWGRPPHKDVFGVQYTARLYPCERFGLPVARQTASLGAEATGYVLPRTTLAFATFLRLLPTHPAEQSITP